MGLDPANLDATPEGRRAHVVDQHLKGRTFAAIGEEMGFSKQRAHQLYREAMDSVVAASVESYRNEMLTELAEIRRVANEIMHSAHVAHSNGRVVVDPDTGAPLADDGPRLDAGRTLIAAHARMAKLLGADAAEKVSVDGAVRYEVVGVDPADVA